MARFRHYFSNDKGSKTLTAFEHVQYFTHVINGACATDVEHTAFVVPFAAGCRVVSIVGFAQENGADGTDPMSVAFEVKKNGTAVCSTNPALDKTAGTGQKTTAAAATGVTQAVVKTDSTRDFAFGDKISINYNVTITTPDTALASPGVIIGVIPFRNES